ncbi:MAG: response regulator [Lachnospiraceae bacterium]|nr:response regulator [Lachnospiraceae bacterium]
MFFENEYDKDKKLILVADDDAFHSHIVSDILKNDYNIAIVNNGLETLIALNKLEKVDLILLDMVMPVLNGYGVLQFLKELPKEKVPHIILTTSLTQEYLQIDEYKDIIDDVLYKPFNEELLTTVVSTIFKKD